MLEGIQNIGVRMRFLLTFMQYLAKINISDSTIECDDSIWERCKLFNNFCKVRMLDHECSNSLSYCRKSLGIGTSGRAFFV